MNFINKNKLTNLFFIILSIFVILPLFLIFFNLNKYSLDDQPKIKQTKIKYKKEENNIKLFSKESLYNDSIYTPLSYNLL